MNVRDTVEQRTLDLYETNNITISKPALGSNLTQSTLNGIINIGGNNPTLAAIVKIRVGLKITVYEFFDDALLENVEQEVG